MKRILLLSFLLLGLVVSAWAQRAVTGKVTDASSGDALPGVAVRVKNTSQGVVTDMDGNYRIEVADNAILQFSFIGYTPKEIPVGTSSVINVQLGEDVEQLEAVVVTALGTKQNAKEVTYANQTVGSEQLLSSPSKNTLEALRGKTAGVKITTASGSVGASSRIVLRGEASLTGNNNALIVVDGIPIDNTTTIGGDGSSQSGYADFGNRFNDLDPNNIESVTILKGPSATSLYGSRGASGVVLITTKSGSKKFKIGLNSTTSFEKAYILLQRQDKFGQGILLPDGSTINESGENFSWGAPVDGIVRPWTSPVDADGDGDLEYLSRPFSAVEDQLQNFFNIGRTLSNTVNMSGGTDMFTYYASYGNTMQKGILDNTDYTRHNFVVNTDTKLSEKLRTTLNLSYSLVDQNTTQEGSRAFEGQNPYALAIQAPITIPYDDLRDYNSPFHDFAGFYGTYTINPYFAANEYINNGKSNNVLVSFGLNYKPIKSLTLNSKIGVNYVSLDQQVGVPQYAYKDHYIWQDNLAITEYTDRQTNAGYYSQQLNNSRIIDWTATATHEADISESFKLTTTAGANIYDINNRVVFGQTVDGFVVPGLFNLGNSKNPAQVSQNHLRRRIVGIFGNAQVGWQDKVFLTASVRNDYSSTLPVDNQSFLYGALGASAVVSDLLNFDNNHPVNYFKVRTSYGTTGKDAGVYLLNSTFTVNPEIVNFGDIYNIKFPLAGQTGIDQDGLIGNNTLEPELTKTFEAGADISLFRSRVELAYTYYNSVSEKQIVVAELPRSSGFTSTPVNIGELTNKGHELSLILTPLLLSNGFKWQTTLTWSKNISEVTKISEQTDNLTIFNAGGGVNLSAVEGQPYGTWRAPVPKMTADGKVIVSETGFIQYTDEAQNIGSIQPDWQGGIVNTFSFKGLSLGFVLDARKGGLFYSNTKYFTDFNGTSLTSLYNDRKPFIVENSVVENEDGTFSPNTTPILINQFLDDGDQARNLLDASFVKLREVTLGYSIPKSIVERIKISDAQVSLFVRNPKFWLADENTFADPEISGPGGAGSNAQGIESTQIPVARSYGINLNLTF